jgi:hypothetical protein
MKSNPIAFKPRPSLWRFSIADALALAVLLALALSVAGFLLRDDVFLYGDHPGHYWIMWYTLNVAVPLHHRLVDWIPYWYAGYPELQFTPPGFVLLGWLLNLITLGKLSTALIYEIVTFTAYALPAFTFYYAIRHLGFDRVAAFTAGLFGLVFPAFIDGATALFIGMIGSRMAWALNALVLVWTIDFFEGRGARYAAFAALMLAVGILAHPYHAIGILLALGLYVLLRRLPLLRAGARLFAIVGFAAALDAFWLAPLFAHSSSAMIPLLRATLDQTWRILTDASLLPYAVLALFAMLYFRRESNSTRRTVIAVLIALFFVLAGTMLAAHAILIDQLHIYRLDPIRLIGEYYLALTWLAAIGLSEIGKFVSSMGWLRRIPAAIRTGAFTVLVGIGFLNASWQSLAYFQPKANDEPRFLSQAIADYRLREFWDVLRATPGRVLFTSYATNLTARGTDPFPTTLAALTPLFSNRPLMGGTYSHWSPIAAEMWVGATHPPVLQGLSQEQDDRSLFGVPLEKLSDAQLIEYCNRFNITAIVASINDIQARTFLDASPRFQSYYNNGFFFVYELKDVQPAWIEAKNANVELAAFADDHIDLHVRAAQANAQVSIKVYAYPLWRAVKDDGQVLQITADDLDLQQVALPRGENYSVTLRYEEGIVEQVGNFISISSLLVFAGMAVRGIAGRFTRGSNAKAG